MDLKIYATHVNLGDFALSVLVQSSVSFFNFELTEMTKKVFPIQDIEELEGEE